MSTSSKKILHVEDDSDFHTYVDALLFDVATIKSVFTVKEFNAALMEESYDLFILDLVLRDGSGFTMSKKLKIQYPDTPIILLSAHNVMSTDKKVTDVVDVVEEINASFIKGKLDEDAFISTVKDLLG